MDNGAACCQVRKARAESRHHAMRFSLPYDKKRKRKGDWAA
jgi:hypothetical protein